jgi:hypothetical protein
MEAELAMLRARVRELEAQVAQLSRADDVRLVDEDLDLALLSASDAALV